MRFALGPGRQIIEDFVESGDVRFVYRHLAFLGPESVRAAEATECAAEQGRFWEYLYSLFENFAGTNVDAYSDSSLVRIAGEAGLNATELTSCLGSGRYAARVQDEAEAAADLDVDSTPTVFINGRRVRGLDDYEVYRRMIEEELAKAR